MSLFRRAARVLAVVTLLLACLLVAAPAFAHVTVRADDPAPEAFAKYTVRVPNEAEDAATTKVEIELPAGMEEARIQPLQGWEISVADGRLVIEGGSIEPGQFQEFSFSAQNPSEEGDLTFPALQTYDNGDVVRWVGEPDSDEPAPVVAIAGEAGGHGHAGDATEAATAAATEVAPEVAAEFSSSSDVGSTVPIVLSVLALIVAAAALLRSRRS